MSAAITHEDVKRVYERFDNARIVQKGAQIEFVTMHFDEKELKELIYMLDMLKAYMDAGGGNMNDDLISRNAVLDACSQSINILDAMSRIDDLPPVTPKQRTGHWEKTISENGITSAVRCSECGFEDNRYMLFRYCPNCGAKMVEQQESEEQA